MGIMGLQVRLVWGPRACGRPSTQDLAPRLPWTMSLPVPRPLPSLTDSSSSLRTGAQGRSWMKEGRFLPSEERGRERPHAQEPHRALLGIRTPPQLSVSTSSPTLGTSCRWHHICPLGSGFSLLTYVLKAHPRCSTYQNITPLKGQIILHCIHNLYCVHPCVSEGHSGCFHQCSF